MRKHRWVKTEFGKGGSLSIVFKYGTTDQHTSFAMIYSRSASSNPYVFPMMYQSPHIKEPKMRTAAVNLDGEAAEINRQIWAELRTFYLECEQGG